MSSENKKTALIVEDSPTNLMHLERLLSQSGLHVICARDGEEGLRNAQERLPDIIVLDVVLPGINGFQVCKSLKENRHTRSIPIILFTDIGCVEAAKYGIHASDIQYISKGNAADKALLEALQTQGLIGETCAA